MIELSAELCMMHIMDTIGLPSSYRFGKYSLSVGHFVRIPDRDFDTSKYLTPEIVEWLETYMILPEITE